MPVTMPNLRSLRFHPAAPARVVGGVSAGGGLDREGRMKLAYRISAAPRALHWNQSDPPGRRDELWRHTCCEAFLATGPESYLEFNFSPDGSWAAYAFSSYRRRAEPDPALEPPEVRVRTARNAVGLEAIIDVGAVVDLAGVPEIRMNLAAVVEETGGPASYWALRHPSPQPDFHDAGGFVLTLSPAQPSTALEDLSA